MHHPLLCLKKTLCVLVLSAGMASAASPIQERADRFLALVNAGYKGLVRVSSEAQWLAVTDVTPAHDAASETAGKASAAFNGNPAIINEAKELLTHRAELNELTLRQLDQVLRNAAEAPMTNPELVARVEAGPQDSRSIDSVSSWKTDTRTRSKTSDQSTDRRARNVWEGRRNQSG